MKIPRDPFDRKAQDDALFEALTKTENTAIYLDTSSLVWMYRLAYGARAEFMEWATTGALIGKVHVPAWALHELHRHRRSTDTLFPARPKVGAVEHELRFLKEAASLFVDDDLAAAKSFSDRSHYLSFLEKANNDLIRSLKVLRDVDVSKVEEHLLPFFEKAALPSRLPNFHALESEYLARGESRIPPGYQDSRKKGDDGRVGGDGANRFGDLALWKEILSHSNSIDHIKKVIIITHDGKEDWIFAPTRFLDYAGKVQPNNSKPKLVTCPHPTLCIEAALEAGVEELYVLTIPQLIQLISTRGAAKGVQNLARAVQIEQEANYAREEECERSNDKRETDKDIYDLGRTSNSPDEIPMQVEVAKHQPSAEMQFTLSSRDTDTVDDGTWEILNALSSEVIADANYKPQHLDNEADQVIINLKSYNWYKQNPAVDKVLPTVAMIETSYEQVFILARNVYQAASGNSNTAMQLLDRIENFLSEISHSTGNVFFAGLLFEAYFGSDGKIRPQPKSDYLHPLFRAAESVAVASAVKWFRSKVGNYETSYLKIPGDTNTPDTFIVKDNNGIVSDIQVRSVSIVELDLGENHYDALPSNASDSVIRNHISSHFAISSEDIQFQPSWQESRDLSHLKFISWGPSTDVVFSRVKTSSPSD